MLANLLQKKLKRLEGEKIIVVMEDETAFLGVLEEFDEGIIVLTDVCEGPSSKIRWDSLDQEPNSEETSEELTGFVDWVCVNLKEVYLRVDNISRVWPWKHEEDMEEKRTPTYTRTPAIDLLSEDKEVVDEG